jgi:predicted nucleic acid-binding protein
MPNDSTVFVDTNVLLYAFDDRDAVKRGRSQRWLAWCWNTRRGRVSSQVVNEFYANALRKFTVTLPKDKARAEVRRLWAWKPWLVDEDTVQDAWALQDRFPLNYWDALMIAAARQMACAFLLTEDLQHDQQIDGVHILNPFLADPEIVDAAT